MDQEKIANFIKRKRIEMGYTQEQLAELINVSSKTISRWERGMNIPDSSTLKVLAIELGVSVTELIAGEEKQNNHLNSEEVETVFVDNLQNGLYFKICNCKKIVLWSIAIALIVLIDISLGYFSAALSWQIYDKTIFSRGIVFTLLFGNMQINTNGVILTYMFTIFIITLIVNILLILTYVFLSIYQTQKYQK